VVTALSVDKPRVFVLTGVDEPGWKEWVAEFGPVFRDAPFQTEAKAASGSSLARTAARLEANRCALATFAPRGIGPTAWAQAGSATDIHIRRRFALLGQTLDGQRVWDARRALAALRTVPDLQCAVPWMSGKNQLGVIMLYAGIFEPDVARIDLWRPPTSPSEGPIFLNVRRFFDLPQALALAFPKQIQLHAGSYAEAKLEMWGSSLQNKLGIDSLKIVPVPH
jgi:hypothetical protein